jgi:hypothetical protein
MEHLREAGEIQERLSPLPPLCVGIPNAIGEQPIQIGKVWITVDVEAQAFAIVLARPLAIPRLPPRIIRVEVEQPRACQPQCGQRSMSHPSRCRSPNGHAPIGRCF